MLDLIKGDLVRLKGGELAVVSQYHKSNMFELSVVSLNGFGDFLWWGEDFIVNADTGKLHMYPHKHDIVAKAKIKKTFFSYKVIETPLTYY